MHGSLEKIVLSQSRLANPNQSTKELILSKFLNLQIRREDFEQIDQPLVLQGEIAQVDYHEQSQRLILSFWWLARMEEDEEGHYWSAFGQLKQCLPVFSLVIPPERLKLVGSIFGQFGTASVRDQQDAKIEYTFFPRPTRKTSYRRKFRVSNFFRVICNFCFNGPDQRAVLLPLIYYNLLVNIQ